MKDPNRFYTYAYLRKDKTPYYIGKGSGRRIYDKKGRPCKEPKNKLRIIFLKQNLTEEEAFKHEIYMIAVFGRKDLGTGILYNRTDGGEGPSGAVLSEEHKRKISKSGKGRQRTKGKVWWNDGCGNTTRSTECPGEGWVPGRGKEFELKIGENKKDLKWWNDGCGNSKRSVDCPGDGWVLGMREEMKMKRSMIMMGIKWWNNGCGNDTLSMECPGDGWVPGRVKNKLLWWNDGKNQKRCKECPGEGWVPGRGKIKMKDKDT